GSATPPPAYPTWEKSGTMSPLAYAGCGACAAGTSTCSSVTALVRSTVFPWPRYRTYRADVSGTSKVRGAVPVPELLPDQIVVHVVLSLDTWMSNRYRRVSPFWNATSTRPTVSVVPMSMASDCPSPEADHAVSSRLSIALPAAAVLLLAVTPD